MSAHWVFRICPLISDLPHQIRELGLHQICLLTVPSLLQGSLYMRSSRSAHYPSPCCSRGDRTLGSQICPFTVTHPLLCRSSQGLQNCPHAVHTLTDLGLQSCLYTVLFIPSKKTDLGLANMALTAAPLLHQTTTTQGLQNFPPNFHRPNPC